MAPSYYCETNDSKKKKTSGCCAKTEVQIELKPATAKKTKQKNKNNDDEIWALINEREKVRESRV